VTRFFHEGCAQRYRAAIDARAAGAGWQSMAAVVVSPLQDAPETARRGACPADEADGRHAAVE
jgi:hypothetical protein